MYLAAKSALQGIQRFWPQMKLDGYKNLWLLKQSNLNCGKGVQILNTLEEIIEAVGEVRSPRYVIQKYIGEYRYYIEISYRNLMLFFIC